MTDAPDLCKTCGRDHGGEKAIYWEDDWPANLQGWQRQATPKKRRMCDGGNYVVTMDMFGA